MRPLLKLRVRAVGSPLGYLSWLLVCQTWGPHLCKFRLCAKEKPEKSRKEVCRKRAPFLFIEMERKQRWANLQHEIGFHNQTGLTLPEGSRSIPKWRPAAGTACSIPQLGRCMPLPQPSRSAISIYQRPPAAAPVRKLEEATRSSP